jgi:hypothetical protein
MQLSDDGSTVLIMTTSAVFGGVPVGRRQAEAHSSLRPDRDEPVLGSKLDATVSMPMGAPFLTEATQAIWHLGPLSICRSAANKAFLAAHIP